MADHGIELRHAPYPFQAMLAVCSDLDETPDARVYAEIARFLNTTDSTAMGPGVGLEVGNTIYFDMPPDQFAYWTTDDAGREMIHTLIRSGHIDCLHSYGDLAGRREDAARSLDELNRHGCRLEVWVDHSKAPTNFGADIMMGHGDEPGHEAYHADLTLSHGVRYVWRGRITSMIGQDARPSMGGLLTLRHPLASGKTVVKEAGKRTLAGRGHAKYAMHGPNRLLESTRLRDGAAVIEFLRCNPHWGGVSAGDTALGIGDVLTPAMLDRLTARRATCILYTHLGKISDHDVPLPHSAVGGFRRLAAAHRTGRILVTTTRRLLGFQHARRQIDVTVTDGTDRRVIDVRLADQGGDARMHLREDDLPGLTFLLPDERETVVSVDGRPREDVVRNPPDETGSPSVSIPWQPLEFPSW